MTGTRPPSPAATPTTIASSALPPRVRRVLQNLYDHIATDFIAALLLGMMQAVGAVYLPEVSVLLPFIFMIAILVWKPSGLAGSRT